LPWFDTFQFLAKTSCPAGCIDGKVNKKLI